MVGPEAADVEAASSLGFPQTDRLPHGRPRSWRWLAYLCDATAYVPIPFTTTGRLDDAVDPSPRWPPSLPPAAHGTGGKDGAVAVGVAGDAGRIRDTHSCDRHVGVRCRAVAECAICPVRDIHLSGLGTSCCVSAGGEATRSCASRRRGPFKWISLCPVSPALHGAGGKDGAVAGAESEARRIRDTFYRNGHKRLCKRAVTERAVVPCSPALHAARGKEGAATEYAARDAGRVRDALGGHRHIGRQCRAVTEFTREPVSPALDAPRGKDRAVTQIIAGPVPVITARWRQRTTPPGSGSRDCAGAVR